MFHNHTLVYISREIYLVRGFLAIATGLSITLLILIALNVHLHFMAFLGIDVIITLFPFYFSRNWYKGKLTISFDAKEIRLSSYLPLFRRSREYRFLWEKINQVSIIDNPYFRVLMIKDAQNRVAFAFDYEENIVWLKQVLDEKTAIMNQTGCLVTSGKPKIYETKASIVTAIVLGLLMICWPVAAWMYSKGFQAGLAIIFYSGAGYYIYRVYRHHKQKVNSRQ